MMGSGEIGSKQRNKNEGCSRFHFLNKNEETRNKETRKQLLQVPFFELKRNRDEVACVKRAISKENARI